jgi:hypothetical protein
MVALRTVILGTRIFVASLLLAAVACPAFGQADATATAAFELKLQAGRTNWAFAVPKDPAPPTVKNAAWCKSPIDQFILAKLEEKGLKPAPAADKRTLIRRAYFDLIGLPPKPEEVEDFVRDDAPNAFEKVVDRLLASPHYGERWARHWLDVVRYTDSFDARGVASAGDIKFAWRYRDWVIKAFNEDLPYDQFVMNQIAGDQLPAKKPGDANSDGTVATCMYVMGNWPGGDADREKMMTDIVDDQVDVTGRAFLGLTLACARCHDHKFDPIAQQDYYGLAGIFFSSHFLPSPGSKTSGSPLVLTPMASAEQVRLQKEHELKLAALQKSIDQYADEQYAQVAQRLVLHTAEYTGAAAEFAHDRNQPIAQFASDRNLDADLFARWIKFFGAASGDRPAHKLLTKAIHNASEISGVDGWIAADGRPDPCVLANNTDHPVTFSTLTIPAKSISMHPGPKTGVAAAWTSPISGSVHIRGKVIDGDPNCGDGIDWRIEQSRAGTPAAMLASGSFPNSGSQEFSQGDGGKALDTIEVKQGDVLELTVFPKATYVCDSTIVEFEITQKDGDKRIWNLSRDVVPDLLVGEQGNPHADTYGNAGVWRFVEAGEESAAASASRDLPNPRSPFWIDVRKDGKTLSPEAKATLAKMSQDLAELKKNAPAPVEEADALIEGGVPQSQYEGIHDCHLMTRGRYDRQGPVVPRGFPRLLAGDEPAHIAQGSGRPELARWIASPSNPMTAKVMINRIWQHHFGEGIVRTPNNFGKLGVPPTHPELLDYLAHRFTDSGWSIKAMHRVIMLSAAYQQSSSADEQTDKADPGNLLFGRMNRQRLEAEPFRDALLAVTESLDESMGGVAFRDPTIPRRTIYLMTIRSDRSNYRTLFDAADPTSIVDKRMDSTVAPQALFLMNNPFVLDRAKTLVARILKQNGVDDRTKIDHLYQLLYSRPASEREVAIGLSAVQPDASTTSADELWLRYCQVLLCANEFVYVD